MSTSPDGEENQDPGPVKQSDAERVTDAEAGTAPGQEPDKGRSEEPPGRTETEDE